MSGFSSKLTDRQVALARAIQRAGLASYSQAVKALLRHEDERIAEWKRKLDELRK